ncbi:MAG: membrane protein insertase YidC [Prevotella sp.]|nr:membrane protein insertase YidC [Prevotella sp.]
MDKNTITGFVLIAALLIGFGWYNQPSAEQIAEAARQDSIAKVEKLKAENQKQAAAVAAQKAKELAASDTTALFYKALQGKAQDIKLKNSKLELTFSTQGAVVRKAVIKNFKDKDGHSDVTLFEGKDQQLKYMLEGKEENINTAELFFTPSQMTDTTVTFTAEAAPGKEIVIAYQLGKDYLLHSQFRVTGMSGLFSPSTKYMDIEWTERCKQQEKGFTFENRYSSLTYHFTDGGTDYLNETSEKVDEPVEDAIDWVAFKNQFFSAVMIARDNYQENALMSSVPHEKGGGYLKDYTARLKTAFDPTGARASEFEFYYGPNDFRLLQDVEEESTFGKKLQLERLVYLGWPLFRIINRWFTLYIFDWLTSFGIPMGIVIILITLILKAITYPMVKKSYMSSAKMRVLRPILNEKTKHLNKPEDQMKKQQEMMLLQQKYGVSMMSGCLPMLIQMPIWIAMFNFVPNAIQLRGQSFLWIDDLSTYDPIIEWHTNLWLIGDHLSLTCILFCVANLVYSWFTMQQQKDQMIGTPEQQQSMKMMQYMMFLMPLMFFFMFNDYSSGLNFYYFVSLFCSATIMFVLRKTTDDEKLLAILQAKYKENEANPKKLGGLAGRLQKMQEQQAELERQRQELRNKRLGK